MSMVEGNEILPFEARRLGRASLEVSTLLNPGAYGLVVVASARNPVATELWCIP